MKHNVLLILPTIQPNGVEYLEENSNVFYAPDGKKETLECSYITFFRSGTYVEIAVCHFF